MKILIKNATIITMDNKKVIKNGYILINERKIEAVGSGEYSKNVDQIIDAKGNILMPGLVNAHTHSPMTLLRNYADGYKLQVWLNDYIFPIEEKMTEDDYYWGSMLAILEMLSCGTTCFADMYFGMEHIAKAVLESGIKANLSRCIVSFDETKTDFSDDERVIEAIELHNNYHNSNNGNLKIDFSLHSVYLATPNCISYVSELAKKYNTGLQIHASETITEINDCIKKFSKPPIAHLNDLNALYSGTTLAHCVHITDEDINIITKSGAFAVNNPTSNLKLASGICPTHKLIKAGAKVAIGTDGASSNNNLNIIEEMHLAALLPKGVSLDPEALDADAVLKMATLTGSEACGRRGESGIIKEGYDADIIMIDTTKPHNYPMHSPANSVVYCAQGSDVCMTMVAGKILYQNGEFKTVDYEKVKYNINKCKNRLFN